MMGTSSQKYSSSPSSSKKYLSTPSTTSESGLTPSSTSQRAHHGSHVSHNSLNLPVNTPSSASSQLPHQGAEQQYQHEAIKRYENEPRDYKSWTVKEYDAHQAQASEKHHNTMSREVKEAEWAC